MNEGYPYPPMKRSERPTPTPLARAQGQAESEHRLYERELAGRRAAQKRVLELEAVIRDARRWIAAQDDIEDELVEIKAIVWRPGVVSNGYAEANRSKQ